MKSARSRPLLLDLYCKAGGAAMGFFQAGFDVVGVDKEDQPNYPFPFVKMDALHVLERLLEKRISRNFIRARSKNAKQPIYYRLEDFMAIHASPPCQKYSKMTKGIWPERLDGHDDLIVPTRELLIKAKKPYSLENVETARHMLINPIKLCGTMFGLRTSTGSQLVRHRYFELSIPFFLTPTCQHNKEAGQKLSGGGKRAATIGVYGHAGGSSKRDGTVSFGVDERSMAMGIDWMTNKELAQAIPPAYTKYIGLKLIEHIRKERKTK